MRLASPAGLLTLALASSLAAASHARAAAGPATGPGGSWTVYHHDPAGSGVAGPVARIDTGTRKWTSPALDGDLYGEPLIWDGRVYVATENNTIYALSATTGRVAWSTHLGTPVPADHLPCGDISPTVGITGTPVIDPGRQEIFAVADEMVGGKPAHRLVGLSTATGTRQLTVDVDPAGSTPAALLQRTGLTLTAGKVVFGFGANAGDCSTYRGRVAAVPESGGAPAFFTVDAAADESQGGVWMGGAAQSVDADGNVWAGVGNGSVFSSSHAYDYGMAVLKLSPSMRLQHFYAPSDWAQENQEDQGMATEPALLANGQVVEGNKDGNAYLLSGTDPGGIGGQLAKLHVCDTNIDGGVAVVGDTVYLPCLSGIAAVRAAASPPSLQLSWNSGNGGGPPIFAAHLIWTIGHDGTLSALDPATGQVQQRASIGVPANHFPTPAVGDGVLVAPSARTVVAFTATASSAPTATGSPPVASPSPPAASSPSAASGGTSTATIAAVGGGVLAVIIVLGGIIIARRRTTRP
jgi:outer membrane protein assembly factor BamB